LLPKPFETQNSFALQTPGKDVQSVTHRHPDWSEFGAVRGQIGTWFPQSGRGVQSSVAFFDPPTHEKTSSSAVSTDKPPFVILGWYEGGFDAGNYGEP